MDTRTGQVTSLGSLQKQLTKDELQRYVKAIDPKNLSLKHRQELIRAGTTFVRPRSRCPCGSGKRFKSCCMSKQSAEGGANG
jgi:uncharacterized protein YecA (UPF0149 family)